MVDDVDGALVRAVALQSSHDSADDPRDHGAVVLQQAALLQRDLDVATDEDSVPDALDAGAVFQLGRVELLLGHGLATYGRDRERGVDVVAAVGADDLARHVERPQVRGVQQPQQLLAPAFRQVVGVARVALGLQVDRVDHPAVRVVDGEADVLHVAELPELVPHGGQLEVRRRVGVLVDDRGDQAAARRVPEVGELEADRRANHDPPTGGFGHGITPLFARSSPPLGQDPCVPVQIILLTSAYVNAFLQ